MENEQILAEEILEVVVSYRDFEIYFKLSDLEQHENNTRIYQLGYGEITSDVSVALNNINDFSSECDDILNTFGQHIYENLKNHTLDEDTFKKLKIHYDENYGVTVQDIKDCLEDNEI